MTLDPQGTTVGMCGQFSGRTEDVASLTLLSAVVGQGNGIK